MVNPIEIDAITVLKACIENPTEKESQWFSGESIQKLTSLSPSKINDAVDFLNSIGATRVEKFMGTAPFRFGMIEILTRGRYLYHEIINLKNQSDELKKPFNEMLPNRPYNPIGSPYGFTEENWDAVALQKQDVNILYVVIGLQYESQYYDSNKLIKNINTHFENAIESYNEKEKNNTKIALKFDKLEAGYGDHLFNSIAASIIGSDISVFDTSDKNSNVMIELGVALTWGVRILPIRENNSPEPPSDISGHTWIKYENSGENILDEKFSEKLEIMIKRTIAGKGE